MLRQLIGSYLFCYLEALEGCLVMIRHSVLVILATLTPRELLICSSLSVLKSSVQSAVTSFWMTVEPVSVTWIKGCLGAAGCDDSRLTLSEWNLASDERTSSSWSIHELFDSSHMFVSYWNKGRPADIAFNYEIIGADPIYGFSRTCDSTRTVRIFDAEQEFAVDVGKALTPTTIFFQHSDKVTLNLTGKCFNATVIVQKYESNCPWCFCSEGYGTVGQLPEPDSREVPYRLSSSPEALLDIGLITLSAIAVVTSAAFSCMLIAYLRERQSNFGRNVPKCCDSDSAVYHLHQTVPQRMPLANTSIARCEPTVTIPQKQQLNGKQSLEQQRRMIF